MFLVLTHDITSSNCHREQLSWGGDIRESVLPGLMKASPEKGTARATSSGYHREQMHVITWEIISPVNNGVDSGSECLR